MGQLGRGGCLEEVYTGLHGKPEPCAGRVAWTGLVLRPRDKQRPAQAWQVFACAEHGDDLVARRRLLPRDWALLTDWRDEAERWQPGHPRRPDDSARRPRPLAEGPAAFDLVNRARRWAAEHPNG